MPLCVAAHLRIGGTGVCCGAWIGGALPCPTRRSRCMRASQKVVSVVSFCLGLAGEVGVVSAQTSFEAAAFSDPNLIAAIFAPPPSKQTSVPSPQDLNDRLGFPSSRKEFHARTVLPPIPEDWEAFDKQFAPHQHPGQPSLQLLENGFYEFNQTIRSEERRGGK